MLKIMPKNKLSSALLGLAFLSTLNAAPAPKSCTGEVFNIKINETMPLSEVLNQVSDLCNFTVVPSDELARAKMKAEVDGINIKDQSLYEVLDVLLSSQDLDYTYSNNTLKVAGLKTQTFKLDYITSVREGAAIIKASVDSTPSEVGGGGEPTDASDNIITSVEKFDFWDQINQELHRILNNGAEKFVSPEPIMNKNAGLITVTGTASQIKRVSNYIATMQKRLQKQVMLDVSIITVELNNNYTTGINWENFSLGFNSYVGGKPSGGGWSYNHNNPNYSTGTSGDNGPGTNNWRNGNHGFWNIAANLNFNIDGLINFLETKGKSKVVSNPKIMTLNNQQALITVGNTINYQVAENSNSTQTNDTVATTYTQYSTFVGILLNILPTVSDDNKIMLRINPSVSEIYGETPDALNENKTRAIAPDTTQKKLSTVVHVENGDTVIIGGLINENKQKKNTSVPVLSQIPVLGNLFKSTEDQLTTQEIVFVITPRIINAGQAKPIADSLRQYGYSKSLYSNE